MIPLLQRDQHMHMHRYNYKNILISKLLHNEVGAFVGHIATILAPTEGTKQTIELK